MVSRKLTNIRKKQNKINSNKNYPTFTKYNIIQK